MSGGSDKRLEELFVSGNDALVRRMRTRVGSVEDAEDMVQEGYLRLLAQARRGRGAISDLKAYLGRSLHHLVSDHFRRQGRERAGLQQSETVSLATVAAPLADPERTLETRQQLERIRKAINRLPVRCRQAFILHRFHGLGYSAIAARLGVSVSSVEKYIMQALDACRREVMRGADE